MRAAAAPPERREADQVLWIVAALLVVLWLLGLITAVAGGWINLLLFVAALVVIYRLRTGGPAT